MKCVGCSRKVLFVRGTYRSIVLWYEKLTYLGEKYDRSLQYPGGGIYRGADDVTAGMKVKL